jgi:hypothetical protein
VPRGHAMKIMTLRVITGVAAVLLSAICGSPAARSEVPTGCANSGCMVDGRPNFAYADYRLIMQHVLVHSELPKAPVDRDAVRSEAWVFELVIGRDGHPCHVALARGPHGPVSEAFSTALRKWTFLPWPRCFRTQVFLYVREQQGRPTMIVPGLEELGR